jgi:hypothetical protein
LTSYGESCELQMPVARAAAAAAAFRAPAGAGSAPPHVAHGDADFGGGEHLRTSYGDDW